MISKISFISLLTLFAVTAFPLSFDLPIHGNMVGTVQFAQVQNGEDYTKVAQDYDVGYYSLFESNPNVDPDNPVPGTILIVPTQYVLPKELHNDIVINLAEMRLYYESDKLHKVFVYPIGIGREGWVTPIGKFRIMQKVAHPVWIAPDSIMKYRQEHGDPMPSKIVQPGPDNPLGTRALRLSQPDYLIHGNDDPAGIGRRISAGCIRMYNSDVEQLFSMVKKGTKVVIINKPYKVGELNNKIYLEAHMPLSEDRQKINGVYEPIVASIQNMAEKNGESAIDSERILAIVTEHLGVPRGLNPPGPLS